MYCTYVEYLVSRKQLRVQLQRPGIQPQVGIRSNCIRGRILPRLEAIAIQQVMHLKRWKTTAIHIHTLVNKVMTKNNIKYILKCSVISILKYNCCIKHKHWTWTYAILFFKLKLKYTLIKFLIDSTMQNYILNNVLTISYTYLFWKTFNILYHSKKGAFYQHTKLNSWTMTN